LPAAGSDHRAAEPGVVCRHHLCADGEGVCVSNGGDGLVQSGVLSWRVSISMDTDFCVAALHEAGHGGARAAEIFDTDQGVQFTSADFLAGLEAQAVRISMDGKGRYLDNIFIERLWWSLKYEEIFLNAYARQPRRGVESARG
jgi:transposase InsO family protein